MGPVGALTARYRALADEAAVAARKAGAQVIKVYSPNATWPAVQEAITGASIVVYLGHGNGWPSRYRDSLYPPTQNGFGLNPVAGVDDRTHQYFGEAAVDDVKLAPNAVVVLSHLCYASGNSEPGLPEGSESDAVQRVDNFAAGFLRAGARAVVAEAYLGPAYYVKALLAGRGSIEGIWAASPTANGRHPIVGASTRTTGYTYRLDPERADGGYVRSLVSRGGLTAGEVRGGAMGTRTNPVIDPPAEPSLVADGIRFRQPWFRGLPVAASATRLVLPLAAGAAKSIPQAGGVSVRWDPLVLDAPVAPADPGAQASPAPAASPAPGPEASPGASPAPDAAPPADGGLVAPDVDLVVPEQLGTVVEPVTFHRGPSGVQVDLTFPTTPGLYRLVATLHTPDGVAYDAATQALLTPVLVHVRPATAAAYGAPARATFAAGTAAQLPVNVVNAGSKRWDLEVTAAPNRVADENGVVSRTTTLPAQLVATWVSANGAPVPAPLTVRLDDAVAAPGGSASLALGVTAPAEPGDYLLLLDVVTASVGPLSAQGTDPAIVHVTVVQPAPEAAPTKEPRSGPRRPDA